MNVCRIRNFLANYIGWYFDKESFKYKKFSDKETTLGSFIFCFFMSIFVTLFFSWNILIIRILNDAITPILEKKFVCDNYKKE